MYLCDNIKLISIHVLVEPAGKKRKCKRCTNEILAKHLKETAIQDWELQRVSNKVNPKQNTLRHIIVKMAKVKDQNRILKAAIGKQRISLEETHISLL